MPMTVRRGRSERRALIIAAALIAPLLATGCATPLTHLEWGTRRTAIAKPAPRPARYASYDDSSRYAYSRRRYAYDEVPVPSARPRPSWYEQSRPAHVEDASYPPDDSSARFSWPVRGRVISDFGAYAGGGRNDGINIAAPYGEPIHAAADGTVSYSGSELKSYGNLILLRHPDGYVTAYAHAERIIVEKGDHVARGQVIGYVGSSGDVSSPQLHFELRKGARGERPIDPRLLLGPAQVAWR
jgi:murein DD-endopeptidase MepM/ murein hydrolase activator NlpD